jgi:hypothetical protein
MYSYVYTRCVQKVWWMVPGKKSRNKLTILKWSLSFTTHCWQRSSKLLESVRKGLFRIRSQNPLKTLVFVQKVRWNSNFTMGDLSFWGVHKLKFYSGGLLPILGAHSGLLWFRASKSNFTLGVFFFSGVSQTQILLRGFCPFWGPTGAFWGSEAQNQTLFRELLPIVRVPNSNLTLGILPIFGPRTLILLQGLLLILGAHWGL